MLRAFSASNGSTNTRASELVALGLAESRQSYFRGVALSREPPNLQQAQPLLAAWDQYRALLPSCDTRCWRAELGMRHADLLRAATAVIATPASARCMRSRTWSNSYLQAAFDTPIARVAGCACPSRRIPVCCSQINSHNQVRGHRTGSSHFGAEEYPREKTQTSQRWYTRISQRTQFMTGSSHSGAKEYPREKTQTSQRWYTRISQRTQFMPPPETYKSEIGSQPTMCQVHTCAYISLLALGKTDYTACHPRKTTTYVLHVVPITTHTHDRRKSTGKKKKR